MLVDNVAIAANGKLAFAKCERWQEPEPDIEPDSSSESESGNGSESESGGESKNDGTSEGGSKKPRGGCGGYVASCIPVAMLGLVAALVIFRKKERE